MNEISVHDSKSIRIPVKLCFVIPFLELPEFLAHEQQLSCRGAPSYIARKARYEANFCSYSPGILLIIEHFP